MSNVIEVYDESQFMSIINEYGDNLIVVDFSADWCQPCHQIYPYFIKLSQQYTNVVFLHIDIEKTQIQENQSIEHLPTFKFYKYGNEIYSLSGANFNELDFMLKKYCN